MTDLSRREALFVAGAIAGTCACCAMTGTARADDDDKPRKPKVAPPKSLVIGKLADFPKEGIYAKYLPQTVVVARLDDRLVAMTNVCPHKGCPVKPKVDDANALKCPCHKAEFDVHGAPTKGPAKTALDRFALTQAADGTITVDLTKSFIESKWEDPASFVAIKA